MSQAKLKELLVSLERKSKSFRDEVANSLPHVFFVSKESIIREIYTQIAKNKENVSNISKVKDNLSRIAENALALIEQQARGYDVERSANGALKIRVSGGRDNYRTIKDTITKSARKYIVDQVNRYYRTDFSSHNFLDTGHHSPVSDIATGFDLASSDIAQEFEPIIRAEVPSANKYYDIRATVDKKGNKTFEIYVELESSSANRGKISDRERNAFTRSLKLWVDSVDWANQESSESMNKLALKRVLKPLEGTFKGDSLKITPSTSRVTYRETKKGTSSLLKIEPVVKGQRRSRINIIALINRKLPDVVAKNMGLPKLVYRTGRFAGSVRAVGLSENRDSLTITYTYMRYPYQIFEVGSGSSLATPDRDPRKVIDLSIREIAREVTAQRFYTKRI